MYVHDYGHNKSSISVASCKTTNIIIINISACAHTQQEKIITWCMISHYRFNIEPDTALHLVNHLVRMLRSAGRTQKSRNDTDYCNPSSFNCGTESGGTKVLSVPIYNEPGDGSSIQSVPQVSL